MRHVSRTHRVVLDWLPDRINLDSKIQIKHIDTRNQLADMLTKGNFTRDEWNHHLCLFNISHFSSTDCSEVMSKKNAKRIQVMKESQQNRSRWWIWSSRCSERTPHVLPSTASESSGARKLSSIVEQWDPLFSRTHQAQERKSDKLMEDRTGRPVVTAQHTDRFIVENDDMDSDTIAESEMSLESRSFLHRVNDQVRKRHNQSSKRCNKRQRQTFCDMVNVHVFYIASICIHTPSKKQGKDITMKQMFDISEKLIAEQSDEIYGVNTINWCDSSWKHLSLIGDEEVISLLHTKVYVFSDSVLCLGKVSENPKSNIAWEERLKWFKSSPVYRALDTIDGEPMEFEWKIFAGFTTLQLCTKVQELLSRLSVTPEKFTGRMAREMGLQGRSVTGGGGLARVPNLRVCKHLPVRKDELTSCRGTVWSAWQKPPVRRKGGRAGLPARVSGRHVVRGRQSSPIPAQASRVSVAVRGAPG